MESTTTQRSRIADELLKAIRAGSHPVGSKLPSERQLSEQFGVSRPVIREALGMLATLDVIEVQMGRGAFVINADVALEPTREFSLIDIVDAREVIERGALRLAAQRAGRSQRDAVGLAIRALERAVSDGVETTDADVELHRTIVDASGSAKLAQLWRDMTAEIVHTVRISPHGRTMSRAILDDHNRLAAGVTEGTLDDALTACATLYDDHRAFLRSLLG